MSVCVLTHQAHPAGAVSKACERWQGVGKVTERGEWGQGLWGGSAGIPASANSIWGLCHPCTSVRWKLLGCGAIVWGGLRDLGDPGSREASNLARLSLHRGAEADEGLRTGSAAQVGTRHGTLGALLPQDLDIQSSSSFLSLGPGGIPSPNPLTPTLRDLGPWPPPPPRTLVSQCPAHHLA